MDIYEIEKSSMEKIRIALTEFKGHKLLDIRLYYDVSETKDQDFKPTKKGISIPVRLVEELKKGIDQALTQIEAKNSAESPQERRSGQE